MEKKTKPASKATFLESIPSQLRYAYLALKKKQDDKPVRDRDRDLNAIISGHNFGYLSFEKICKNVFEPEGCLLRFDAVSCQLVLEMSSSKEVFAFQLLELIKPSSQFETANKRNKGIDAALVLCVNVMTEDDSGCKIGMPLHFISGATDVVLTWKYGLKNALSDSAGYGVQKVSDWGASFLWRVWRTVPAPEVSLYDHLFQVAIDSSSEVSHETLPCKVEFGPEKNEKALSSVLAFPGVSRTDPADGSPTSKIFDNVLYRDSRAKSEALSYFELLSSENHKEVHRLRMLQQAGIVSEIGLNMTTACAAELWDDAYGMAINPRISPFDGVRADGNTALHFICNQDPNLPKSSLGNGSIYEKLLRVLLEKGDEQIINAANRHGVTPLMIAVFWSNFVLVQLLVSLSADVSAEDAFGNTCFHYAVAHSNPDVLNLLCSKMSPMRRQSFVANVPKASNLAKTRFAKIHAAISLSSITNPSKIRTDDQPSDMNSFAQIICSRNSSGYSCLHLAIARDDASCLCAVLAFLCDLGLHSRLLCAQDHRGETPLHFACRKGSIACIMVLLLYGSRVGAMSDDGSTAESLLRQYSRRIQDKSSTVQLLMMLGQVVQKEDRDYEILMEQKQTKDGSSSLVVSQVQFCQVLCKKRKLGIGMPSILDMLRLLPSLVSYCPNLATSCDWIMKLVETGDLEIMIRKLNEMDETISSCIDMTDSNGNTLLHKAVEFNNVDLTFMLLDAGADAAKENASGVTAVHIAASHGVPDIYSSLISSLLTFESLFLSRLNIMQSAASGGSLDILDSLCSFGGSLKDDDGGKNGILEAAIQHQQLKTSIYIACLLPLPSWPQSMILEIRDFVLKLEDRQSNWCILIDKTIPDVQLESQNSISTANGLMIAQSLTSNEDSALWKHASDELWQSLSTWQSREEHRFYLVHIAVINRRYQALDKMFMNGHTPNVLDAHFRTPIFYACVHGDWKLVAVLRTLYLAPFWHQEGSGSDMFDDALVLESIRNDDKYVLLTLLLLNTPLAQACQEIVIDSETSCADLFPSSICKAFEMKNQHIFLLLIQWCFCHSKITTEDGSFRKIIMNLNSAFVCNANLESVLDTTAILHQFVDTVEVIMKPDISSAGIASNRLNEHAEGSTPDAACDLLMKIENGKVQNDQNLAVTEMEPDLGTTAILHQFVDTVEVIMKPDISSAGVASNRLNEHAEGSTPDATCDLLMKIENGKVQNDQNLAITEIEPSSDAFESEIQLPHSPASSNFVADESFSNASVFKLPNCEFAMGDHSTNCAGRAGSETVLQASVKDTVNAPPMDAIIATLVSAKETSESLSSIQITEVDILDNHVQDIVILTVAKPPHSDPFTAHSSDSNCIADGHYVVKESLAEYFDTFELEVDPVNRNLVPAIDFKVIDVMPVVQVEDRVAKSFLNACKLGMDQVLVSLVDAFSIDSMFRCPSVAEGTPLHFAILSHSLSTVEILLKWKPALILEVDKEGRTPLHIACSINFHAALSKILNMAISMNGKVHKVDREGHSSLTLAVKQGALECVELLAKTENDALIPPSNLIPCALELSLTSAIYTSATFLRLFDLCAEQAIRNFRSSHDNGLLHIAVKHQRMHSVCAILQRMGEGFAQVRDATGRTAVEIAASGSNNSMFNLLVQQTQDLVVDIENRHLIEAAPVKVRNNYFDESDLTKPYKLRCFPGGNPVVSSLIDQIYSCVVGDAKGSGILHLFQNLVASGNAHLLGHPIFTLESHSRCTCLHLAAGVNSTPSLQFVLQNCSSSRQFIDLHNSDGLTACAVALIASHTKCAKLLLQQGSRIITETTPGMEQSFHVKKCNLLSICAKYCHDSSMMDELLEASSLSNIIFLDDSNQSLLHICAHVNNVHAYNAIVRKAPHAIGILINHRDNFGNTALHICASNSASLNMASALVQSGCYLHLRNYEADLPCDIAGFMGNMDIAQLTRWIKTEEFVNKSNYRVQCDDFVTTLVEVISHDNAAEISEMCKSPLWIGSWMRVSFMSSPICAQKAANLKMASALSHAGFCAMMCPDLVENLLGLMLKNQNESIIPSLDIMFTNCSNAAVSSFLMDNVPTFLLQVAREKDLDVNIYAWVVQHWTRLSVCDLEGFNALQIACQNENSRFFNAIIQHLEKLTSRKQSDSRDEQVLLTLKSEMIKALSSRNNAGRVLMEEASCTPVASLVAKLISLISFQAFQRIDPLSNDLVFDISLQRHITLVSLGMIEPLFEEANFDVEMFKNTRDKMGRCLVANACISGRLACVSALLEKGLSPSLVDLEGLGILQHAVLNHHNDIVNFIIQRFPQKVFDIDSKGGCLLHQAIRSGSDDDCLSTLKEFQKILDNHTFLQLCFHSDDSKRSAVEEAFTKGKYYSGLYILHHMTLKSGPLSANSIHVFENFVLDCVNKTFHLISEFNALIAKISSVASTQNSLMSFLRLFCSKFQPPFDNDDVLQPQNFESAISSVHVLDSDVKSSSFFSGQWVCLEETFSEHFLVSNDASSTRSSLAQIFSSIYDHPAFSNCVRPSISEALMAHSLRLNWILQDGVPPSDCERVLNVHSELIRQFLVIEMLSSVFHFKMQTVLHDNFFKLVHSANPQDITNDAVPMSSVQNIFERSVDWQKMNSMGIYPPTSTSLPEAVELLALVSTNNIDGIVSCLKKSTNYLTMSIDHHKNTLAHAVAFFCTLQDVEKLIGAGLQVNARNESGQMPLHFACLSGRFEVAQRLFRKFKNTELPADSYGHSLIHFAALSLNENCLASVQKTCQIAWDLTTSRRQTALDLLLEMDVDPKHAVCTLLAKGEALTEACKSKLVSVQHALQSSLITSCKLDLHAKAVCCVHAGADIRSSFTLQADNGDQNSWNAVDVCAVYNSHSVLKCILENVSKDTWQEALNHCTLYRMKNELPSSIWVACKHKSIDALRFLLENGSNLLEQDERGLNIFAYCITLGCNDSLSELLRFCSANFEDVFLRKFILAPDKMGQSCVEYAIQGRYPQSIRILREFLIERKLCNESDMINLGQRYLKLLCHKKCDLPPNPCATFLCILEVLQFLHSDVTQALLRSYQDDHHPLQKCSDAGRHDCAVLLFTLHFLARIDFDGNLLPLANSNHQLDSFSIAPRSGSTSIWNCLQLIERILHAFTGQRYLTQRYLSGQIGRLITKLDDHSVHLFSKLLVSANEPILKGLSAWEDFFRRSSKAFDELFVKDVPRHDPYSAANFTAEQNAAFDAIYRGDCPALNMIIHRNPKWYLDPKQNLTGVFYAQCYVAAIHGDQEHILEFLIQKGFLYSQLSGEENLLMLASRLGRSKIVKSLSQRPFLKLDVNYSAADGMRALHLACSRNHSETLKSLISNFPSIDIHVQNVLGESAVSLCVKYGHLSAIETLIESVGVVAFLSILNASKQNIFHLAASAENPAMLHSVLSTILKAKKQTHVLGDRQPSCDLLKLLVEINKRVTQPEMSQILIAALLAPDINGDTPAHICIHSRSIASLAMLIHVFPIAVLIPNASGSSPIHIAASRSFYSLDLFRVLISASKSLGQWIFDDQSIEPLAEENYVDQASLIAVLCHFEDSRGMTIWDITFAENVDAQSLITKFLSLCRMKNPRKSQIDRVIGSSILKTLLSGTATDLPKSKRISKGLGSIYLASIDFLQHVLHRCKLNRWYLKQLEKRKYEAGRSLLASVLLQKSWRHHIASKKMKAAKYLNICYIRIQCLIRTLLSRRVFILRKNFSEQVHRVDRSRLLWSAYQRFSKKRRAVESFQVAHRFNSEYRDRCSISGAVQLQAAIMSHHLFLLRKLHAKRRICLIKTIAAGTLQRVYRGREGRRLFLFLRQLSENDQCLILPTGRKLRVHKYFMMQSIRRVQFAIRHLLAKRQLSIQHFFKHGLKSCCLIQRAWLCHFSRVKMRRAQANQKELQIFSVASKIQKHCRSKLSRIAFRACIGTVRCFKSVLMLQCAYRCRNALQLFRLRANDAAFHAQKIRQVQDVRVFIETESLKIKRERVERHLATLMNKAATIISSFIRGVLVRCTKLLSLKKTELECRMTQNSKNSSAEKIQHVWLRHCALKKMTLLGFSFGKTAKQIISAKRIILHLKVHAACKKISDLRRCRAVIMLQQMWRVHQSATLCHKIRFSVWEHRIHALATKIQAVAKAHRLRISFATFKMSWPKLREMRISKKVMRQLFNNFQSSKFHRIVLQTLMNHKNNCVLKIQCAFRSKNARSTFRCVVCLHNMTVIDKKVRTLQKFWRRCSQEKSFSLQVPWLLFPWPSADIKLEASSWSVFHAYDVRLEGFMQSKQFDDYDKSLSAACQFGIRQLQEVPDDAAHALQSLVRFAASMCETALYHGNKRIAFSLASRATKLMGTEKNKFVLNCTTEFSAWVHDTMAHVLYSRGLFPQALSHLNEAIVSGGLRSSPDSNMLAILHFHKGLVYQNLCNTSSAMDNFSRACQLFQCQNDISYSIHHAAALLALSSAMSCIKNFYGASMNCSAAKGILSRVLLNSVHGTFYPPSMCWRSTGLLQMLRRIESVSNRFIRSALLKIERSQIQSSGRVFKSRPRRFFNRSHFFPKGFESWSSWSCLSIGIYGIVPERAYAFPFQKLQDRTYHIDQRSSIVTSTRHDEYSPSEDINPDKPLVEQDLGIEEQMKKHFLQMQSTPVLIHPWHLFKQHDSTHSTFRDFQFLLSSCLDVSTTTSSQQRWLKLLESYAPDGKLPSFVKALVTSSPSATTSKMSDSDASQTSVKMFSASPNPIPRKDLVSCLHRALIALLQRAYSSWYCLADGQGSATECRDCVQLMKDVIDSNINSLKHAVSKTWKNVIVLCDAVMLALLSNYSEAFNCCMRVHDDLHQAGRLEVLEVTILGLSSCNAAYSLWHFQKLTQANVSLSTTIALSEMLSVDVKLALRMAAASDSLASFMFHNLGHIAIECGEYLRAFSAWGEAHKILETVSKSKNETIQETILFFVTNDEGLMKSSVEKIDCAISKWLSIQELLSSSEYRVSIGIHGIRDIKQIHQKIPKKQKEDMTDVADETPNKLKVSLNIVRQNLPEELFSGLFGSGANRVRTAALLKSSSM